MSRSYGPCLCCDENWPDEMLSPVTDDEHASQLCPHCRRHAGKLLKEIATLREQLKELRAEKRFSETLRASK